MLNGIVLGTVWRIVGDSDFQHQPGGESLKCLFEYVMVAGIAASAVAENQQAVRIWILPAAVLVPPVVDTITKQVAGIVAHIQINIPLIVAKS